MRLWLLVLLVGCAAKANRESLVLSGRVSDSPGGGVPVCPWSPIVEARAEGDVIAVNGRDYHVGDAAGAASFLRLLAPCDRPAVAEAFAAWRAAEEAARHDAPRSKVAIAPSTTEIDTKPLHERQPEDAWAEEAKRRPLTEVPPELQGARDALVTALVSGAVGE